MVAQARVDFRPQPLTFGPETPQRNWRRMATLCLALENEKDPERIASLKAELERRLRSA